MRWIISNYRLELNSNKVTCHASGADRLLDVIREQLSCTGTKEGCGEGECGACTVIMDGLLVNSCLVPAFQAQGSRITTVESVDLQTAHALNVLGTSQCGACTPGIVMTTRWLRDHPEALERMNVREFMSGNLCRCTGYDGIIEGVQSVLRQPQDGKAG